jgi:(p)ppGpp synthase/HD superfamily hydrolase
MPRKGNVRETDGPVRVLQRDPLPRKFTLMNALPDVFLMPPNSTALDLAFKVHTDIGKHFIGAIDARTKKRVKIRYFVHAV